MWEQTYTQNLLALSNPNQTKPIYNVTIWNVNVPVDTLQGKPHATFDETVLLWGQASTIAHCQAAPPLSQGRTAQC